MSDTIKPVGVIGAGKFGLAVTRLLSHNASVLLFTRKAHIAESINETHKHLGFEIPDTVSAISDLEQLSNKCDVIFPIVPAAQIRNLMRDLGKHLKPSHILIHGIKGLNLSHEYLANPSDKLTVNDVKRISSVIKYESLVRRVGCLSGPNLSDEILAGQPTATVVASQFDEVIKLGQQLLASKQFYVFGSHDLIGAEIAGALKNVVAIATGMMAGMGMGKNLQGVVITRGLREMILIGKLMGSEMKAFIGTAGIGDLIATATSEKSRNYRFGLKIAQGMSREEILSSSTETVEGIGTLEIVKKLIDAHRIHAPISRALYEVVFGKLTPQIAVDNVMKYPMGEDVDYL